MRVSIRGRVFLAGTCILAGVTAWGQSIPNPTKQNPVSIDLGATYAPERSEIVPGNCCFWMQGGGADAAVTFWKGFGIAAALTGDHASSVASGIDINKMTFMGGPRYTYTGHTGAAATPRYQISAQGLFGGVHGFDGLYPEGSAVTSSASGFALQAGGGFDYYLTKHWGLRLFEANYVRTDLPNNAADVQNDLRLSFGVVYHIGAVRLHR
jgi:hypothetical protein